MRNKKCKAMRKAVKNAENIQQETVYTQNENTGQIKLGQCARGVYQNLKHYEKTGVWKS